MRGNGNCALFRHSSRCRTHDDHQHGGIHSFVQFGPVGGVLGFGLTSGAQYAEPGMLHDTYNVNGTGVSATETFVNNFQILGQGRLPNRNFHEIFHITVNANGEITVVFDKAREVCR